MEILTNHKFRPLIYGYELTDKEKEQYDFLDWSPIDGEAYSSQFFRYKNYCYYLGDFMRLDKTSPFPPNWHGYSSDSFFSGILIELSKCGEAVKVGTYYS